MKKKSKDKSTIFLMLVGIAIIAIALGMLIPTLWDYKKSEDTYEKLEQTFVQADIEVMGEETKDDSWWYQDVNIDLAELEKLNADIVGWIRFDNIENLSYPILYSGDDEKYLRTDLYGNSTIAGSIFMEGMNAPNFQDLHTILYGHNMRNGSMFGKLKNYKTAGFYEENSYFTIYTKTDAYRYQIFSYRDVPETDEVYQVGFVPDAVFQDFINLMIRKSYYDTGVKVTKEDKIVTLSTCSSDGNRFIVHAVRVAEHTREDSKGKETD